MCGDNIFKNLCRLCLGTDRLLYIFHEKMADNMAEIIELTSGVQISKSDAVTQLVCSICCQITIKMYKFRMASTKNDKELKARFAAYNIAQLSNPTVHKTDAAANVESLAPPDKFASITLPLKQQTLQPNEQKYKFAHPSIKEIIKVHPNIRLPEISLKSHFGACVNLLSNEVDQWFRQRNASDDEISLLKKVSCEQSLEDIDENVSRKRSKISCWCRSDKSDEDVSETLTAIPVVNIKRLKLSRSKPVVLESKAPTPQENSSKEVNLDHSIPRSETSRGTDEKYSNPTTAPVFKSFKRPKNNYDQNNFDKTCLNSKSSSDINSKTETNVDADSSSDDDNIMMDNCDPEVSQEPNENRKNRAHQGSIFIRPGETRESESGADEKKKKDSKIASQKISDDKKHEEINNNRDCEDKDYFEAETAVKPLVYIGNCTLFTTKQFFGSNNTTKPSFKTQMDGSDGSPSQSLSSNESLEVETITRSFTKSIDSEPRDAPCNQPDFSLLSANRWHTLYVCKICESHHHNLRDLKYHKRKNHSKSPFCNKKFRSLANRDEHIKENCVVNQKPLKIKPLKLSLVRVDEDEEIRRKYSETFENMTSMSDAKDPGNRANAGNRESEQSDLRNLRRTKPSAVSELSIETKDVVEGLEKLQKCSESIHRDQGSNKSSATSLAKKMKLGDETDIICISDEETEPLKVRTPLENARQKVNTFIKNFNILNVLKDNHLDEFDVIRLVKNIITSKQYINTANATTTYDFFRNSFIIDGKTPKEKIFKNLRKHLQHYKIKIEIKYNPTVVVEYKFNKAPTPKNVLKKDLWTSMVPQQVKQIIPSTTTQATTVPVDCNGNIFSHQATTN